ncbi:MAG: ACP S-malonyltransferase, partial [Clostridiales Family XIII bacterium]|nr:ACP S-malonyltransferase [Clostridiales Family XIII bacterium]
MKIGLLFSGQGAQYGGMGRRLYDECPAGKAIFDRAGGEIRRWCFDGDKETLTETRITQPAIYTVSMAAWAAFEEAIARELRAEDVEIAGAAGFSLGEYAAYTAAGVIGDFETGLAIVRKRGEFMSEAGRHPDGAPRGAMAALMGAREAALRSVEAAKGKDVLEAVNFNAPNQTVAAGDAEAVERLKVCGKAAGLKVIPLHVSTAFHTPIMIPAAENLRRFLTPFAFGAPRVPVYSNVTGKDVLDGKPENVALDAWIRERMAEQAMRPVYWQETIENMFGDGIRVFVEFGPGRALTKL